MTSIMLTDAKNALWRAASVMSDLSANGVPTGGIHGFLTMVLRAKSETKADRVVICWDDWEAGPTHRRAIDPTYKNKLGLATEERTKMLKDVHAQQDLLMEFLTKLGVRQVRSPGWEADDVMGTLAAKYVGEDRRVVIYTGDQDLLQCVSPHVTVLRPLTNGTFEEMSESSVQKRYGVTVKQFVDFKALVGDAGDNIKGAPGIGEKSAAKILQACGGLRVALANAEDSASWSDTLPLRWAQILAGHGDQIRRAADLACINCEVPLTYSKSEPDAKAAKKMLIKLKMANLLLRWRELAALAWRPQ